MPDAYITGLPTATDHTHNIHTGHAHCTLDTVYGSLIYVQYKWFVASYMLSESSLGPLQFDGGNIHAILQYSLHHVQVHTCTSLYSPYTYMYTCTYFVHTKLALSHVSYPKKWFPSEVKVIEWLVRNNRNFLFIVLICLPLWRWTNIPEQHRPTCTYKECKWSWVVSIRSKTDSNIWVGEHTKLC